MAAPLVTAAAVIVDRYGSPVTHIPGQQRVRATGMTVATAADSFIGGTGPIATATPYAARVHIGGVPVLSAEAATEAGLHVVSDQTRVRIG